MKSKDRPKSKAPALETCPLCHKQVRLVHPERGRSAIECECGLSFELAPDRVAAMAEAVMVELWNKR